MLAPMGLRLSPDKTRVVHIDDGFDFLGFHIRRMPKRGTSKPYVYTIPSTKAHQAIRDRTVAHQQINPAPRPRRAPAGTNRSLRGWANYFRHGVSSRVFPKSTTTPGSG